MPDRDLSCAAPAAGVHTHSGIRAQFAHPSGPIGWLVGHVMARRNRARNEWVLSLLDVKRDDRILEIGFGPGAAIQRLAALAPAGLVAGIDHSAEMLRQARRRNAAAIRSGRVQLRLGDMTALPFENGAFTKALAINVLQFAPQPERVVLELRRVLAPGGLVALALQPRWKGATADSARTTAVEWCALAEQAGFSDVRFEMRDLRPMPTICVLGKSGVGPF